MQNTWHPVREFLSRLREAPLRLARDQRGAIALILAVSLIPLVIATGIAIDVTRIYLVKQRLGQASDAAGLALAAASDGSENLQTVLETFFTANYPASKLGTPATPSYSIAGSQITVTAQASVETTFMQIAGIDSVSVAATSQITYQSEGLEVVLVVDNTGSMSGSKLSSLQTAAEDLVDILFGDEQTASNVKIGIVPFTALVNIGSTMTAYTDDPDDYNWGSDSWEGCVEARTYPADVEDSDTTSGGTWTVFHWPDDSYNDWSDWWWDSGPNLYCPAAVTPLTSDKTTLTNAIDAMVASGPTHVNVGAIWGWRLISPEEPFDEGVAYGTSGWSKAIILMTDGESTAYSFVKSAYRFPNDEVLGTSSISSMVSILDDRLSETCTNIKDTEITLYTITFDVSSSSLQTLMENCATDSDKYYDSPSEDELERTFRAIAAELKKIHLSG